VVSTHQSGFVAIGEQDLEEETGEAVGEPRSLISIATSEGHGWGKRWTGQAAWCEPGAMTSTTWGEKAVADHLLRAVLPGNAVLTGVVPRAGGALSAVHEVRQAGGPSLVVKRYAEECRWKQEKEVYVLGLLNESSPVGGRLRVPEVVHVDTEQAVTVMTLLPGRPLSEVSVDGAAERAVLAEVGELTRVLHGVRQPAFGYVTTQVLDPLPTNRAYMTRQFDKKLAEFADLGGDRDLHASIGGYVGERT
jgi:hygromycin-B 7''-O-kinase